MVSHFFEFVDKRKFFTQMKTFYYEFLIFLYKLNINKINNSNI